MIYDVFVCNGQHFLPKVTAKAAVNPQFKENLELVHGNLIVFSLSDRQTLFQEQIKMRTSKAQSLATIAFFSFSTKS